MPGDCIKQKTSSESIDAVAEVGRGVCRRLRQCLNQLRGTLRLNIICLLQHRDGNRIASFGLTERS
jgi:hypothetical protein